MIPADTQRTVLDNGLTVITRESRNVPVISFWIWYRVGSRNERPGITGISHWLEHMLFKGSSMFPPGYIDRAVGRAGGFMDAFTSMDYTAYFTTIPSRHLDLVLRFESDRMTSAILSETDVASERSVVLSERYGRENHPTTLLYEKLISTAFQIHSYRYPIIGLEEDLKTITHAELFDHYRRYYNPSNAIIAVAGDFDTDTLLADIEEHFGRISGGETPNPRIQPEPPLEGERRVTVNGPGDAAYLAYSFRVPGATHEDFCPLVLLDAAYAGGGGVGHLGGGTTNKSSRLYKALVNSDLAAGVSGSMAPSIDPYLYTIFAVARPGVALSEIESALEAELERLGHEPLTQDELDKAIKRARAAYVLAGESVTGQAQMIGMAEAVAGDYHWYENTLDALTAVTLDDIERVRRSYLRPTNRVVGLYQPEQNGQG